jgi:hypothetical protein
VLKKNNHQVDSTAGEIPNIHFERVKKKKAIAFFANLRYPSPIKSGPGCMKIDPSLRSG